MTLAEFKEAFPEFRTVTDPMTEAYLRMAAARISEEVVGTRYDQMHGLLAAHLLATSPGGVNVRLVQKDGSTTYSNAFKEAALSKVAAPMVV